MSLELWAKDFEIEFTNVTVMFLIGRAQSCVLFNSCCCY